MFDRTHGLPSGGYLEQADGTSWMAMYCLNLLGFALELAKKDRVYEDLATKFFEHFVYIGAAINRMGQRTGGLWNEEDGYYYDVLRLPDGSCYPIKAKTISGLIPIFAVAVADREAIGALRRFREAPALVRQVPARAPARIGRHEPARRAGSRAACHRRHRQVEAHTGHGPRHRGPAEPARRPLGVQAPSRASRIRIKIGDNEFTLDYAPGESTGTLFGGNSNWRGPVWFPLNYLLIEALQKHDAVLGETFKVECPTGSGHEMTLWDVTTEMTRRLITLFTRDANGRRPSTATATSSRAIPIGAT